jgi:uracil-DNA glycosylase
MNSAFDPMCRRCPRLAAFLDAVRLDEPSYFCRPVSPFGDPDARLLIVGLAPGKHGANRTGRPFTGDHAGILLYATLHKFGLASGPISTAADDGTQAPEHENYQCGEVLAARQQAFTYRNQSMQ